MNINPLIETAFANFTVGTKLIPIAYLTYSGNETTYLTYYAWLDSPDNYFNDEHHAEITYGTIDIFSKGNFKNIVKAVKKKLKENEFTWKDNGPETFEKDTGFYHVPVNFYYEGGAEDLR